MCFRSSVNLLFSLAALELYSLIKQRTASTDVLEPYAGYYLIRDIGHPMLKMILNRINQDLHHLLAPL